MGTISRWLVLALIVVVGLCPLRIAGAADSEPDKVEIGVYVNKFDQISLKDGKIDVDFYIWFRWTNDQLKPHESFDLVNGQILARDGISESMFGRTKYVCLRVRAAVQKVWDISRFPLDNHDIQLEIESTESEVHKLVYVPDIANSGLNAKAQSAGWKLAAGDASVGTNQYSTNYGDIALPTGSDSVYSQFVYRVRIMRPGYSLFIKLFAGLYVAAGIGFLSLLVRPIDLDPRFGLGVGAMFAAVASQYVLSSNLPDTQGLTMADELHILTFVYIFVTLLESTVSLRLWNQGFQSRSERIDRWSLITLVVTYSLLSMWIVWAR